jgi:farnesyl-diphosphate farnesyltransferase
MPQSQLADAHVDAPAAHSSKSGDDEFQARMLAGVSRTFALTIPELPLPLARVVSNAYLLCRVVDTIEDEPALDAATKRDLAALFVAGVEGREPAAGFADALAPRLSDATLPAERELVSEAPRLLAITHRFSPPEQEALATCVRVMADGMIRFQDANDGRGLPDLATLDRYCYHVAGVVGEMLTRLFAVHSHAIAARYDRMMPLAVSFGEGLQMTNILKDVWTDLQRGACWLPRDVFAREGFDLDRIGDGPGDPRFHRAMQALVAKAHRHLRDALDYTLLVPAGERGIRNFCLWAIGMAVLTLRKIHRRPGFRSGEEVKISRRSVRATVLGSRLTAPRDAAVRMLFGAAAAGLPLEPARSMAA